MNGPLWGTLREYIATEVALQIQRHANSTEVSCNNGRARDLEAQSTRLETVLREGIEAYDKEIAWMHQNTVRR